MGVTLISGCDCAVGLRVGATDAERFAKHTCANRARGNANV